jgi:membrane protein implicated in regulation of membrane protease activity
MPYWGWLAIGVALLILEVTAGTEFWLALIGAAALGVGTLSILGIAGPAWMQWATFGALSIIMLIFVRRKLHEKFVGTAPGIKPELIGEIATAQSEIAPGESGLVELRGSSWQARNVGSGQILEGSSVAVHEVDGVTLSVRAR